MDDTDIALQELKKRILAIGEFMGHAGEDLAAFLAKNFNGYERDSLVTP